MALDDGDKLWILENTPKEPRYQMTYMVGPINVTVRMDTEEEVVPAVSRLIKEARANTDLNAKIGIPTPAKQAEVDDNHLKAKCATCQAEMVYKTGIYKTGKDIGKPYEALFCPNAIKGDFTTHKAIFL